MTPQQIRDRLGLPVTALPLPDGFDLRRDAHLEALAAELLQRFRTRDDVEAFGLLVETSQDRLVEIARGIARRLALVADAEDLVAAFLARLFADVRPDQPRVHHFLGLAYTAMRFDALNQLRLHRRARRRGERWEEMVARWRRPVDPAVEVDGREQAAEVRRLGTVFLLVVDACYHGLGARERRVLHEREILHHSYQQIAETLDLPRGQVGMILKRARERLAHRIATALQRMGRPGGVPAPGATPPPTARHLVPDRSR